MSLSPTLSTKRHAKRESKFLDWDSLWQRSASALPLHRARCLAAYLEAFENPADFSALSVRQNDKLVAALPLVPARIARTFRAFSLPVNPWAHCGDLLVDPGFRDPATFAELAEKIKSLPAAFLSLQWVYENQDWQQLLAALKQSGCRIFRRPQFNVGIVEIDGSWEQYFQSRSKNHRKKLRSAHRRLSNLGVVQFTRHHRFESAANLRHLLNQAWEIENLGWKQQAESSVTQSSGAGEFFFSVAEELAKANMLEIQFLSVAGKNIAFELGYRAKGVYSSHKIGFDPEFSRYSPGQLLFYLQLQHWFASQEIHRVDTMGILSPATAKWTNHYQTRYRYLISTGGLTSNLAVEAIMRLKSRTDINP